jgi:hypothetical protein
MKARVNDFAAAVAQSPRDNLGAAIVAVEAGFGYQDS